MGQCDGAAVALSVTRLVKTLTQSPTWPNHQPHRTAFKSDNGRSVLAAGTDLHAPQLPLVFDREAPLLSPSRNGRGASRRSRPFWLAAALVGVMSMTMNVVSHHTIQSGASNRAQLCESGIR